MKKSVIMFCYVWLAQPPFGYELVSLNSIFFNVFMFLIVNFLWYRCVIITRLLHFDEHLIYAFSSPGGFLLP